ncbi:hypothetical protein Vretimale_3064 [Volvox reticuliferus]|uniref:Uncharacterized protein n=1 Tax=Volvox reticuliferus TaxID=1737510 RepID=A0A8J4C9B5_9CHLO|nr:hypothetical protein Vretifemale_6750 [Volvox reticuliferus]GIL97414.1 hypothetical protein Vretimale_3064 [Volvox reticuliferus]
MYLSNMQASLPASVRANRLKLLSYKRVSSVTLRYYPSYTRLVVARNQGQQEPKPARKNADGVNPDEGPLQSVFRSAASTWSRLDTQQRVYTVIAGAALLIATPQLLTFLLITVERLLVGALLAVEEVLAGVLLLGTRLVVIVGSLALLGVGAYLFLFRKHSSS